VKHCYTMRVLSNLRTLRDGTEIYFIYMHIHS